MITHILTAAIRQPNGIILTIPRPKRHHDILNNSFVHRQCNGEEMQGFLAVDSGELVFLDREQALVAARNLGLVKLEKQKLFSEDLW